MQKVQILRFLKKKIQNRSTAVWGRCTLCGKKKVFKLSALICGNTKACGDPRHKRKHTNENTKNKKFGVFTILRFCRDKKTRKVWCLCGLCGKQKRLVLNEVVNGYRASCGCGRKQSQLGVKRGYRFCNDCKKTKPISDFSTGWFCKKCYSLRAWEWAKRNPLRVIFNAKKSIAKRRSLLRKAVGVFSAKDIEQMYRNQFGKCYYCHKTLHFKFHVDHRHPISRGGTNSKENLAVTCPTCNLSKASKTEEEFIRSRK